MPSRTVTINIKTTADLKQLQATLNAMVKMEEAAKKLNASWGNAGDAKATAAAIKSMAGSFDKIAQHGPVAVDTMRKFNTALGRMDKMIQGIPVELKALASAMKQTANATKSWNDANKAGINKTEDNIKKTTVQLDAFGRKMRTIQETMSTKIGTDPLGNVVSSLVKTDKLVTEFDRSTGKATAKWGAFVQVLRTGGHETTSLKRIVEYTQIIQNRFAPLINLVRQLASAFKGLGGNLLGSALRAITTFGTSAAAMFARLRSNLAQAGGFFTAFHRRVEDSMARSKRATRDFLNSGWSFLTSGYTTRQFGQTTLNRLDQLFGGYTEYERNITRTSIAAAGSQGARPDVIQDMIFGMQRGDFGGAPVKQFTPTEIAEAAYYYASAIGQEITPENMDQIAPLLTDFLQIANVARTNPEVAIKGIINVATEFGIDPRDEKNIPILQETGAQMAYLSNISTLELPDIAESFKMVGPMAGQLGATPQDAMALLYLMSEVGLRGGQAGRGISQTFSRLLDPTDKMLGLGEQYLGIDGSRESWHKLFFDDTGQLKGGVAGMFDILSNATDANGMAQMIAEMFSENATRAMVGALSQMFKGEAQGRDVYQEIIDMLESQAPTAWLENAITENNQTLSAAFAWLETAWFQVTSAMVDAVKGPLIDALNELTIMLFKLSDMLQNNPIVSKFVLGLYTLIGVIAQVVGSFFVSIGSLLLMAKAFSLTEGFALRFLGVIAGVGLAFARLIPVFIAASLVTSALAMAWREDLGGVASYLEDADIGSLITDTVENIIDAVSLLGQAWYEFTTLILGGAGTTENLRTVLDNILGTFLGTIFYSRILNLRDAIGGLREELVSLGQGTGLDVGGMLGNAIGAGRAMLTYASSGFLSQDVPAATDFFESLGYSDGFNQFIAASMRVREAIGSVIILFEQLRNALVPIAQDIAQNMLSIVQSLAGGQSLQAVVTTIVSAVLTIAQAIRTVTAVGARFAQMLEPWVPLISAIAGVIIGVWIMRALIPLDKQILTVTSHIADFISTTILLNSLGIVFSGLAMAIQALAGAVVAFLAPLFALTTAGGGMGFFGTLGQSLLGLSGAVDSLLARVALTTLGFANFAVVLAGVALAVYDLWTTNEGFADRMGTIFNALIGIIGDFAEGAIQGFTLVVGTAVMLISTVSGPLINAFSHLGAAVLPFIDSIDAMQVAGVALGAALGLVASIMAGRLVFSIIAGTVAIITQTGALLANAAAWVVNIIPAIGAAIVAVLAFVAANAGLILIIGAIIITLTLFAKGLADLLGYESIFDMLGDGFGYVADMGVWAAENIAQAWEWLRSIVEGVIKVFSGTKLETLEMELSAQLAVKDKWVADQINQITNDPVMQALYLNETGLEGPFHKVGDAAGMAQWVSDVQETDPTRFTRHYGSIYEAANIDPLQQQIYNERRKQYTAGLELDTDYTGTSSGRPTRGGIGGVKDWALETIDGILGNMSLDKVYDVLGIDPSQFDLASQRGQFTDYASYEAAAREMATQLAIEEKYKELTGRDLNEDRRRVTQGAGYVDPRGNYVGRTPGGGQSFPPSGVDQAALDEATLAVLDQAAAATDETLKTLAESITDFNSAIASIDFNQAIKGMYDAFAGGFNRESAASALSTYAPTVLENLKTALGVEELPWQNEMELMMDAAGTGGFLGQNVTGRNLHNVLRPFLETFAAQSGVSVEALLAEIPMFSAPEEFIGMGQADLVQYADSLTADTYKRLDLFGQQAYGSAVGDEQGRVFAPDGFDWEELANFGTAMAASGDLDWNLTDYIMEAWDLTRAEAEAYITQNGINPNIISGTIFDDTSLYAQAMGGKVNVLTQEWVDYFNMITKNGTDKTIEITQEAFDQLPDIVKIAYSNMGYQFILGGDMTHNQIQTQAEATKQMIEDTYGNIPDHLAELLDPEGPGGRWSTSIVDGMVTIYDDLGNIKFVMPEADYYAWIESNNVLQAEVERMERLRDRLMRIKDDLRGKQDNRDRAKENQDEVEEGGYVSTWGTMAIGNMETEIATLEERAARVREALGWVVGEGEVPEFNWEGILPTQAEIDTFTEATSTQIVTTISTNLTDGAPIISGAAQLIVDELVRVFESLTGRMQQIAAATTSALAVGLGSGSGAAYSGGFSLGAAAGQGVVNGLRSKQGEINAIMNSYRQLLASTPTPAAPPSGPSLPPWMPGGGGGTPSGTGNTVSVSIGQVNAGNQGEVTQLLNRIDEGLGNKYKAAARGQYATGGNVI